jgi:hypothetical protein
MPTAPNAPNAPNRKVQMCVFGCLTQRFLKTRRELTRCHDLVGLASKPSSCSSSSEDRTMIPRRRDMIYRLTQS